MKLAQWMTLFTLFFFVGASACFGQTGADATSIGHYCEKFTNHRIQFAALARASPKPSDWELNRSCVETATATQSACICLWDEFVIVTLIADQNTKKHVQRVVARRAAITLAQIDSKLQELDGLLSLTTNATAGLVTQANKLKDDLKTLRESLQAISKRLPRVEPPQGKPYRSRENE